MAEAVKYKQREREREREKHTHTERGSICVHKAISVT